MTTMTSLLSPAYKTFLSEAPKHAQAWMQAVQELGGLPAAGNTVVQSLPAALRTFDQSDGATAR